MEKNSKIYIAGHTGLVGSAIMRNLQAQGYTKIITRMPEALDLTRQADTGAFFAAEKPDYVFLAAAKVGGILANSTYVADFIYDNLLIASNVIHAARLSGVKKLLNLGSSCIYPRLAPQPIREESLLTGPLEPTNEPYAIAKIAAIKLCRYSNEQYGTNFISVMPTNTYGPGDNLNLETAHVLPALIRKFHLAKLLAEGGYDGVRKDLRRYRLGFGLDKTIHAFDDAGIAKALEGIGIERERVMIWGDGNAYREFIYIDDLAKACIFVMERCGYKEMGEFINVGTGSDILIRDLVNLVKESVGSKARAEYDDSKPTGTPRKLLDVSKITKLGWKPLVELKEGIGKEYDWYLRNSQGTI